MVKTNRFRSSLLFLASFYAFLLLPLMPLWAQGLQSFDDDVVGPKILLNPEIRSIRAGESLTIKAGINDSSGLEKVTLFYRSAGAANYSSLQMTSQAASDYSATISAQEVSAPTMEYYIQATDKVGNMSVRGVKQFPLTLTILSSTLKKPWYKKWWVWTIAAAVVGGVAAGSGGGGGSAGNPTTGTATVSGPVP